MVGNLDVALVPILMVLVEFDRREEAKENEPIGKIVIIWGLLVGVQFEGEGRAAQALLLRGDEELVNVDYRGHPCLWLAGKVDVEIEEK